MATAHHVGGPLHGSVVDIGATPYAAPPEYRWHSETTDAASRPTTYSDTDQIVFIHSTLSDRGIDAIQSAVHDYWRKYEETFGTGPREA